MNLPQRDDAHFTGAKRVEEFCAVFQHALARIPIREAEIQRAGLDFAPRLPRAPRRAARDLARAARARAETVHEPGEARERRRFENLEAAGAA